jgi:hypothetical protein
MKRKYKVYDPMEGCKCKRHYFDLESSMQEYVMIQQLSGKDVSVYDQHKKEFIRMSERTKAIRKLVARDDNVY